MIARFVTSNYPLELGVSNAYSSSPALPGNECLGVTFDDPENKFFTSFTLYDVDGYLMAGNTHINSNMWKPNSDGTITVHFSCGDTAFNSLPSGGEPFNYSVRNYGVSQVVLDGDFWVDSGRGQNCILRTFGPPPRRTWRGKIRNSAHVF